MGAVDMQTSVLLVGFEIRLSLLTTHLQITSCYVTRSCNLACGFRRRAQTFLDDRTALNSKLKANECRNTYLFFMLGLK